MSKQSKEQPIFTQVSSAVASIPIQVEFNGKQYVAKCSISSIAYQDKISGILYYNDRMLEQVGIFPSCEMGLLENKAKAVLLKHLSEQLNDKLKPKR